VSTPIHHHIYLRSRNPGNRSQTAARCMIRGNCPQWLFAVQSFPIRAHVAAVYPPSGRTHQPRSKRHGTPAPADQFCIIHPSQTDATRAHATANIKEPAIARDFFSPNHLTTTVMASSINWHHSWLHTSREEILKGEIYVLCLGCSQS